MPRNFTEKRKGKKWIIALFALVLLIVFRKGVVMCSVKIALALVFSNKDFHYQAMEWQENALCIHHISLLKSDADISIDRLEITMGGSCSPLSFQPHCRLFHPHITLKEGRSVSSSSKFPMYLAVPTRFLKVAWEVERGVLQLNENSLLHFSAAPGVDQLLGTLSFYYDSLVESQPLFVAALEKNEEQFDVHFSVQEEDCARLLPLIALIHPSLPLEWQTAQGTVHISGKLSTDQHFNLLGLSCQGNVEGLALLSASEEVALVAQHISADIVTDSHQPTDFFWQQLKGTVLVEQAEGYWASFLPTHLQITKGEMILEPQLGPHLDFTGVCAHADQTLHYAVKGKGDVQLDNSFWMELNITCSVEKNKTMECEAALCRFAEGKYALQLNCQHLQPEHINFISTYFPAEWHNLGWQEGIVDGKLTALIEGNQLQSIAFEEVKFSNSRWYLPNQLMALSAEQVGINGELAFSSHDPILIKSAAIAVQRGDFLASSSSEAFTHLTQVTGELRLENSEVLPSRITGECGGVHAELLVHGQEAPYCAELMLKGQSPQIAQYNNLLAQPFVASLALRAEGGVFTTEGQILLSEEKITAGAQFVSDFQSLSEFLCNDKRECSLKEGWFETELLTESSYASLLKTLLPGIDLTGDVLLKGSFDPSYVVIALLGSDCRVQHPLGELSLTSFGDSGAQLMYDVEEKSWRGEIPIDQGRLLYRERGLAIDHIHTTLQLEDGKLSTSLFEAQSEGLQLSGTCELTLADQPIFHLETIEVSGDVHQAIKMTEHFLSHEPNIFPIKGDFYIPEKGFTLDISPNHTLWNLTCECSRLSAVLPEKHGLKDGSFKLSMDSSSQQLSLDGAHAVWVLPNGLNLAVSLPRFTAEFSEGTSLRFQVNLDRDNKSVAQLVGQAKHDDTLGWGFAFERQNTHFLGTRLNFSHVSLSKGDNRLAIELNPTVTGRELLSQINFLTAADLLSIPEETLRDFQLEGSIQTKISTKDVKHELNFKAEGRDLKYNGQKIAQFVVRGQRVGANWKIDECSVDNFSVKTTLAQSGNLFKLTDVESKWNGIIVKGKGEIDLEHNAFSFNIDSAKGDLSAASIPQQTARGTFSAQGNLKGNFQPLQLIGETNCTLDCHMPLAMTVWSAKPVKFSYASDSGYVVEDISIHIKDKKGGPILGSASAAQLVSSKLSGLQVIRCDFSLSHSLVKELAGIKLIPSALTELEYGDKLEGNVDLAYTSEKLTCKGGLKEGKYGYKEQSFSLLQPIFRLEDHIFTFQARTQLSQQTLWASISVTTIKDTQGILRFTDHPQSEGLKFNFHAVNDRIQWDSIQGQCIGLNCDLKKNHSKKFPLASVLTGQIQVDASRLLPLLDKQQSEKFQRFQLGKGYAWRGDLVLWDDAKRGFQMTGELTGDECELFGYCFKQLRGTIDVNPTHIILTNAQFEDEAGTITLKKVDIEKKTNWELNIPVVSVKEWRPSAMRKIDTPATPIKPFVIRHFTLTNIHADLSKSDSLEARGHLTFTNQAKKESTIFDTPLEMIKNFGLDPGLLTPVQGEIDVELRGDKLYLMAMKSTFSEAGRSEFYLAPDRDLSYIDLDGKVHIDLKMKQDVMLKITEPFMLTIRGTLEKPRYGLQY